VKHQGTFKFIRAVTFAKKATRMTPGFTGSANVYVFEPAEPLETKVRYAAVVSGVQHEVMRTASGDVEKAILKAAGLESKAKSCRSVLEEYAHFPEPVGCPAEKLKERAPTQSLIFYARAK